jgi:hypothetical protein
LPIPAPATAARRAASLIVDRLNLVPPVDIEQLLRGHAEVNRVEWPYENVDAILLRLSGESPVVYYRATENMLRERFTLAHEFGHIMLPWHIPDANCAIGTGNLDLESYSLEDEADIFASCLLVPDRWLLELIEAHDGDMTEILQELNSAEVTTIAALLALRRVLLSGWVFVFSGSERVATPGTSVPGFYDAPISDLIATLKEECYDYGETLLNGRKVKWYQMFSPAALPERDPDDERSSHQQLVDAISLVEADEEERLHLARVCNGKVGGVLRDAAGRPARETFNTLKYRFEKSEVDYLLEQPDFLVWLAEKARVVESGDTKKKRIQKKSR